MPPITRRDNGRAALPRCSHCEKRHSATVSELSRSRHQAVAEPRADLHKPNRLPTAALVWPVQGRREHSATMNLRTKPQRRATVHQGSRPTVGDRHVQAHLSFGRLRLCRRRGNCSSRQFRSHQHKQLERAAAQELRPSLSRVGRPDGLHDRPGWREVWLRRSRVAGAGKVAARLAVGSTAFDKQKPIQLFGVDAAHRHQRGAFPRSDRDKRSDASRSCSRTNVTDPEQRTLRRRRETNEINSR